MGKIELKMDPRGNHAWEWTDDADHHYQR